MNTSIRSTFDFYYRNTNEEQLARKVNDLAMELKYSNKSNTAVFSSLFIQSFKQCFKIVKRVNHLAADDTVIVSIFQEALVEAIEKWDVNKSTFITFLYIHFSRKANSQLIMKKRNTKTSRVVDKGFFENMNIGHYDKIDFKCVVQTLDITKQEKQFLWLVYLGYTFKEVMEKMNISQFMYYRLRDGLKLKLNTADLI